MNTAPNPAYHYTPIGQVRGGRAEATKDGWGPNRSRIQARKPRW